MKSVKIFSLAILSFAFVTTASAQASKTETFKVSGNCGMCKKTIEKAAKDAGAKTAVWDIDSKSLVVTYKTSSTNAAKIQEKIAAAGYDNAGAKASNEAYDKLHGCCKYDRAATSVKASCCEGEANCKHHDDEHAAKPDCCKDGKCSKPGHAGKDCCKKS